MNFLRFFINLLNKLSAMVVGALFLSLMTLVYNLLSAILIIPLAIITLLALPMMITTSIYNPNDFVGFLKALLVGTALYVVSPIVVAIGLVAAVAYLVVFAPFDFVSRLWLGVKTGAVYGWQGLLRTVVREITPLSVRRFNILTSSNHRPDNEPPSYPPFQPTSTAANVNSNRRWNALNSGSYNATKLLSDDELKQLTIYSKQTSLLPSELIDQLTIRLEQFTNLEMRLMTVNAALANKEVGEIDDEIISFSVVTRPIFFAKQYQDDNGQWHNIPAMGKTTDHDTLLKWFNLNPIHPESRDPIINPSNYNNKPTRYHWHELTNEHPYTQELDDIADELRQLLAKAKAYLPTPQAKPEVASISIVNGQMFFSKTNVDEHKIAKNDDLLREYRSYR